MGVSLRICDGDLWDVVGLPWFLPKIEMCYKNFSLWTWGISLYSYINKRVKAMPRVV